MFKYGGVVASADILGVRAEQSTQPRCCPVLHHISTPPSSFYLFNFRPEAFGEHGKATHPFKTRACVGGGCGRSLPWLAQPFPWLPSAFSALETQHKSESLCERIPTLPTEDQDRASQPLVTS